MTLGVHSEVGRLRRVMVHRPGLEHSRLTPSNAEELLFDDVLWVARAKAEHDMFAEVMRDRGVEVFHAEQLLAEALARPEARDWVCGHILNEREVGIAAARAGPRVGRDGGRRRLVAEFLIGGITRADVAAGRGAGVGVGRPDVHAAAAAAELPVPARPVVLDLRRRHAQPDDQAGPQAGDDDHGGHLPVPPDVRRRGVPDLAGRRRRGLGPLPRRGRRRAADRQRHGDDRHGRAHHPAGGAVDRPVAVPGRVGHAGAGGAPAQVAQLHAPGHGDHDVRPGPGHLFPQVVVRGADLGDPARRVGRGPRRRGAAAGRCPS